MSDLALARNILKEIDILLSFVQDGDSFTTIPCKEIECLEAVLLRARGATANIMASFQDTGGFLSVPTRLRSKANEHGTSSP